MRKNVFGKIVTTVIAIAMVGVMPIQVEAAEVSENNFQIETVMQPDDAYDEMDSASVVAEPLEIDAEVKAAGTSAVKFYSQPEWPVKPGYDCISVYIRDGSEYIYRVFFVTDGQEWLLYDYGEYTAGEFFTQVEEKNGMYIPVKKAEYRKDNSRTADIDESKIPVITMEDYGKLLYDWRELKNVPFVRSTSGKLLYAGPNGELESGADAGPGNPSVEPGDESGEEIPETTDGVRYTANIGTSVYDVIINNVTYDGRKHVAVGGKSNNAQAADLDVKVWRNGSVLDKTNYSLKFYNNKNVNGTKPPMVQIVLKNKGDLKAERAQLAKTGFVFKIKPADMSSINVFFEKKTAKAVINGKTFKLKGQSDYYVRSYSYDDGVITLVGIGNYGGEVQIKVSNFPFF